MLRLTLPLVAVLAIALPARAEEGMWLYNSFPKTQVKERYGFEPTQEWLDRVRLASVRLASGCSGSIVSPDGLVMTNHHCAHSCIAQLSTAKKDLLKAGFYAKTEREEARCPEIEINQLVQITDVTQRVADATKGKKDAEFAAAFKAVSSQIEKECATDPTVRCDVVSLYRGGRYDLYQYRRFQDVRLVFAPERAIAFFGGDPDNFNFPRYNLDVAFLRLWDNGKPAKTSDTWLPLGAPVQEGDLVFVSGQPGGTSRLATVAQLMFERDVRLPRMLMRSAELRGILTRMATESAENRRIAEPLLFGLENGIKARRGRLDALMDPAFFQRIVEREQGLRSKVAADPKLRAEYAGAWDAMEQAMKAYRGIHDEYAYLEEGRAFQSYLFSHARLLVRAAEELAKPNSERLPEYTDARLPALRQRLESKAPIYDALEIATLAFSFEKLRETFGSDDPIVRKVFDRKSAMERATELVKGSKLKDPKARVALLDGGAKAIAASTDPMIALARAVDPEARAIRKRYENEVDAVVRKSGEAIARASFAVYGTTTYPDATFSLRLSYGQVKGWTENGKVVPPFTDFAGAFERATGSEPFKLPKSWIDAKPRLDLSTRFNLVSTNDIIGGNSGSPLIDAKGHVVGLIFDGNAASLAGDYAYDGTANRAVSVDMSGILEALTKIYRADRLVNELKR